MPSVAIIIPTLVGGQILRACLRALEEQTFRDFEVIVVNNGETSIESGLVNVPFLVLSPGSNIGFGAAVNLGIRHSSAPLIATLNDDTEPDPHWLERLVQDMESDPEVGMCASCIQQYGVDLLDSAGMLLCLDGSSKQRGANRPSSAFPQSEEVLLPSACAALYRRRLLDDIGLFDEDFFLYCEDTDLGLRARWAGWRCRYVADAFVNHHYSFTAGAFTPLKARFVERNRLWVAIKNFPIGLLLQVPGTSLMRYLWHVVAIRRRRGAAAMFAGSGYSVRDALLIVAGAHWDTLLRMRELLRKRAGCRKRRKLRSSEFARLIVRHRISPKEVAYA